MSHSQTSSLLSSAYQGAKLPTLCLLQPQSLFLFLFLLLLLFLSLPSYLILIRTGNTSGDVDLIDPNCVYQMLSLIIIGFNVKNCMAATYVTVTKSLCHDCHGFLFCTYSSRLLNLSPCQYDMK